MDRLSLADLRAVDERVLPFNPYGFGGRLSPEDALEFQQHVIAQYELADNVADGTRQRFEQLRHVYRYGVLCYDLFTMVGDAALLAFEQALRDRFINFHEGAVPLRSKEGEVHVLKDVTDYGDFVERYKGLKGTRIQMGPDRSWTGFNGTLDAFVRVDVQGPLALVDAVDGALLDARLVLHVDTRLRDDVGHAVVPPR